MPTYRYTARNTAGKAVRGAADAPDERQLVTRLRAEGLFLMSCREAERDHGRTHLNALQLSEFCRQIGMMLSSGVTLLRAVGILLQRDQKKRIKRVYQGLYDALQRGRSLSEAMRGQHGAFPELLIGMVYAGESSGTLDSVTLKMATFYEKEHRLHNRIISAVIYPVILLCITVLVVIGIFTFVLPNFFDMFQDMVLPVPTQVVMAISTGLTQHWGAVLIGVLARRALRDRPHQAPYAGDRQADANDLYRPLLADAQLALLQRPAHDRRDRHEPRHGRQPLSGRAVRYRAAPGARGHVAFLRHCAARRL